MAAATASTDDAALLTAESPLPEQPAQRKGSLVVVRLLFFLQCAAAACLCNFLVLFFHTQGLTYRQVRLPTATAAADVSMVVVLVLWLLLLLSMLLLLLLLSVLLLLLLLSVLLLLLILLLLM